MRILIIGQTTLHWGRLEFGNIGNYYVIEPFFRELHRVFPNAELRTTLQLSDDFCSIENVVRLSMEFYYSWDDKEYLTKSLSEYGIAELYNKTSQLVQSTPFIAEVMDSDLVIDFSGDVWGDNADFVGQDRFLVGLLKDRTAQLLNKKVVMIAGSPGPFENHKEIDSFTKEVFNGFSKVTNREFLSIEVLNKYGFNTSKVKSFACPSFLFEAAEDKDIQEILLTENIEEIGQDTLGFIFCGWNMLDGPFSKWPRHDDEYNHFAELIEFVILKMRLRVVLLSHSNGFDLPPNFKLTHGRDYPLLLQLYDVINKRGKVNMEKLSIVKGIYSPKQIKAIIKHFDMLVSGRLHGSIAGLSQCVPTVIVDYGHEPKAHKIRGFADILEVGEYVVDPSNLKDMQEKVEKCWINKAEYKLQLENRMHIVKDMVKESFDEIAEIFHEG